MASKLSLVTTVDTIWAVEPIRGQSYAEALSTLDVSQSAEMVSAARGDSNSRINELVDEDGIVRLSLEGPMTKAETSATRMFGGTGTMQLRALLRSAARNAEVKGVFLYVDSPGGQAAGTEELAEDIAACASKKPVLAFVSDMCCSAAYWAASQATAILAEPGAQWIGNIGTYMVAYDTSKLYENEGIEAILFTTGEYKGAGANGVKISDEHRSHFQEMVDSCQERFASAVRTGRAMTAKDLNSVADGRCFPTQSAIEANLIDGSARIDSAYQMLLDLVSEFSSCNRAPAASVAEVDETMSENTKKPSLIDRVLGRSGAASGGAAATETVDKSVVMKEIDDLNDQLANANSAAALLLESRVESDAKAFAENLKTGGKIVPAQEEAVAALYVKAVFADSPGGLEANADGSIKTGETVEHLRASYAAAADLKLTVEQVASTTRDVTVLATDNKPDLRSGADKVHALTPLGRKVLALKEGK